MDKKYCAYICKGCGIGVALDIEGLSRVAAKEMGIECKIHTYLCGEEGRAFIDADVQTGVNTIIVAACSSRVMQNEFDFGPDTITVRANIREQVVWCQDEDAKSDYVNELASDYIRIACTQAKKIDLPVSFNLETVNKNILVIGGGIAGMTAATEAAQVGFSATIVECTDVLGGFANSWRRQLPTQSPWTGCETPVVQKLKDIIAASDKISVKLGTEVARISGAPGAYRVTFKTTGTVSEWDAPVKVATDQQDKINKGEMEDPNKGLRNYMELNVNGESFGSVVLATGWQPADTRVFTHLGHGMFKNVVTNFEFEQIAGKGKIVRPSDGNPALSVAFVQSPGADSDDKDFPYANSVTSMVALKQAGYVREDSADSKAYILYQHMRTPGHMEFYYKEAQNDEGIFLTKAQVRKVDELADGTLSLDIHNNLTNEDMCIHADMVVLGAGMVPTTKDDAVVNLAYRQGPALIDLDLFDGYADSNYICFPYETRRTGIYACGGVRKAMTVEETCDDATGAALKAVQCLESIDRGVSVHPRSGDKSFPEFFFQRCTQCKRCTEECPFGALDDDAKGTPLPNPTRCRRCGTCMGACPERIISFKNYSIDMIGSMIKSIEVPDDDEDKLRILALVCENDAYPALDMAGMRRIGMDNLVRFIPVRCLGSVNMVWIKDALSAGMDGVILLGCKYGDDYQCHFVKGSEIADRRMVNIGETLKSLGLETERVSMQQIAITDYDKVSTVIKEFVNVIKEIGPNPFKGF